MRKNYRYEEIEQFTLEQCKIAKIELQIDLPDIKAKLEDWRNDVDPDLDGERLERVYRHLRRLLNKVELRMMLIKQECGIDKTKSRIEHEQNRKVNEAMSSVMKPKPYHAIFCSVARDNLDEETFSRLSEIAKEKVQELKSELDSF